MSHVFLSRYSCDCDVDCDVDGDVDGDFDGDVDGNVDGDGDGDVGFIGVGHLTLLVRTVVRCALEELMPIPGIKDHVHVHQVELDLVPRLLLLGICHFHFQAGARPLLSAVLFKLIFIKVVQYKA